MWELWMDVKDGKVLASDEVTLLLEYYREKFGERFVCFGYADFAPTKRLIGAEVYRDALREAVEQDEPTRIVHHSIYRVKDFQSSVNVLWSATGRDKRERESCGAGFPEVSNHAAPSMETRGREMGLILEDEEVLESDEEKLLERYGRERFGERFIFWLGNYQDEEVLESDEVRLLEQHYLEKFGECFVSFDDAAFPAAKNRRAAEIYRDALREAVERDEPTRIVRPS